MVHVGRGDNSPELSNSINQARLTRSRSLVPCYISNAKIILIQLRTEDAIGFFIFVRSKFESKSVLSAEHSWGRIRV